MQKRLTKLEVILSTLLFFIPLILVAFTQELRPSISDYAYSNLNYLFASLLSVAGTMFIFNGTAYNSRWYNIVLGCSLIGVVLTPHLQLPVFHYCFASTFFLGSIFCMIFFSSTSQRNLKLIAGAIIFFGLLGHFWFNWYSLFWAEWIGILPICIHYIGESLGKID